MVRAGVVVGDNRPALHRVGDEALVDDALRHAHFCAACRSVYVAAADFPFEADVVRGGVVDLGRAIEGCEFGVDGGGQHIVVHFHHGGGVCCCCCAVGDNGDNGIAHAADFADCERRVRHFDGVRHDPAAWQADLFADVLAGEYGDYAGGGACFGCVNVGDVGVSVGAAD